VFSDELLDEVFCNFKVSAVVYYDLDKPIACGFVWFPKNHEEGLAKELDIVSQIDDYAQIDNTVVLPEYRGKGLQSNMIKLLNQSAIDLGATLLVATVSPFNKYSANNLSKNGFKVVKTIKIHGDFLRDVIVKSTTNNDA
jgi:ribosomal protein S18 acetylase RimI-like enzyme